MIYFGAAGGSFALALTLLHARYIRKDAQAIHSGGGFNAFRPLPAVVRARRRAAGLFRRASAVDGKASGSDDGLPHRRRRPSSTLAGAARGPSVAGDSSAFSTRPARPLPGARWGEALIVENFGDVPFRKGPVGPETIALMTVAAAAVERRAICPSASMCSATTSRARWDRRGDRRQRSCAPMSMSGRR